MKDKIWRLVVICASILSMSAFLQAQTNPPSYPNQKEDNFTVKNFKFQSGETLPELKLHYTTVGMPHKNAQGLCSFAALVRERLAHDPVLLEMARIVQAADIKGELEDHPAAHGLQLISRGFPLVTKDDHETAKLAAFVYDSLYASIKQDLAPK